MRWDANYTAIESLGHHTAEPVITICIDRGRLISFGICSRLLRTLTDAEHKEIVSTIDKTLNEKRGHHVHIQTTQKRA